MDPRTLTKEDLAELLKEAEKAHAEYEKMLGAKDADWANWYADFILKKALNAAKLTTRPIDAPSDLKAVTGPLNDKSPAAPATSAAKPPEAAPKLESEPKPEPVAKVESGQETVIPPAAKPQPASTAPIPDSPASPEKPKSDPATTSMQVCPTCGHRNRFGVLLCENCGTNLATGQQAGIGTRDLREAEAAAEEAPAKLDTTEAKAVRSAGTARFEVGMTLRIEVEGGATPIILRPKAHDMILGRRDPTTGATPEVDLTPYAGYRMGVSRKHASLRLQDNQLNLWDLGSSNGTFINGTRLHPHRPYPIRDGDEIRLGQMVLRMFFQSGQQNRSPS